MICDILERVSAKKVDKCLKSDLHSDYDYNPSTERVYCWVWHDTTPNYNNAFYAIDMLWETILHPTHAKRVWSEFVSEMRRK